jgi:hypothetical protein
LAELQLFTSQSYNISYLELAESYFKLNWLTSQLSLCLELALYHRTDNTENIFASIVDTCVLSRSLRFHCCFTESLPSNALSSTLQYIPPKDRMIGLRSGRESNGIHVEFISEILQTGQLAQCLRASIAISMTPTNFPVLLQKS